MYANHLPNAPQLPNFPISSLQLITRSHQLPVPNIPISLLLLLKITRSQQRARMQSLGVLLAFCGLLSHGVPWTTGDENGATGSFLYRLCVPSDLETLCQEMVNDLAQLKGNITCVTANGKIGCITKVVEDEADFLPLEPEEIFVASKYRHFGAFSVIAEIRSNEFKERDFRYEPMAVIRKSAGIKSISDLRGKKSCHTGFGRNAGWKIPFSHLMDKNELTGLCNEIEAPTPERDLFAISKYFSQACAPGPWVPGKDYDATLRSKYSNMCKLCENPRDCNGRDKYAGYEGALKCLTENNGDVAWTKMDAVEKFFKLKTNSPSPITSGYAFLCWDGSSQSLTSKSPCSWAKRPWRAYLASSRLNYKAITDLQKQITLHVTQAKNMREKNQNLLWDVRILELNATGESVYFYSAPLAKSTTPYDYLRQKNYSVTVEKPSCSTDRVIRICVKNLIEKLKCQDLQLAAIGKRIVPGFDCILSGSAENCSKKVGSKKADVAIMSAKEAAVAKANFGLIPILNTLEIIDVSSVEKAPYKFALALLRADSSIRNLTDLKGKKSCHGSIQSFGGWNVPLNVLRNAKLISGPACGLSIEISRFFNASCVPGVLSARERMPWVPESLCDLCVGDKTPLDTDPPSPSSVCADGPRERYFGNAGALRCLADGVGDVAFIDHVGLLHEAFGIIEPDNLRLLCSNGQIMETSQFRHCNWGKIPTSTVLVRGGDENKVEREDARLSLLKASDAFSPFGSYAVMKLFGAYYGNNDVLFQDESVGLGNHVIDPKLEKLIDEFDFCRTSSAIMIEGPRMLFQATLATTTFYIIRIQLKM